MALTRTELAEMGLTSEQIEQIIKGHTASTSFLKDQIAKLEGDIADFQKQLKDLPGIQKELEELKAGDGNDWQKKYEEEHSAFEAYKADIESGKARQAKEEAYKALLAEAGISSKRISAVLKVTDLSKIEFDEEGKIKDADKLKDSIKTEWADFIVSSEEKGAEVKTPPGGSDEPPKYEDMSMAEYIAARKGK